MLKKPTPTRFKALGFRNDGPKLWRIYAIDDGRESPVGPQYATKAELLGDLERYAAEYGCPEANSPVPRTEGLDYAQAIIDRIEKMDCDGAGNGPDYIHGWNDARSFIVQAIRSEFLKGA